MWCGFWCLNFKWTTFRKFGYVKSSLPVHWMNIGVSKQSCKMVWNSPSFCYIHNEQCKNSSSYVFLMFVYFLFEGSRKLNLVRKEMFSFSEIQWFWFTQNRSHRWIKKHTATVFVLMIAWVLCCNVWNTHLNV